jgi:hypothetical protein
VLTLALVWVPGQAAGKGMTDDEYIGSLGHDPGGLPVDRKRLARIFFSLAATLDGGKSSVELLHANVVVPESSQQAVDSLLDRRFAEYERALARYRTSVTELLDEPESLLLLYRTLVDGQRTCWQLDRHNWYLETYGSEADLLSILSSYEACSRLRTAAFQPRVEAIVMDALVEQVYQRQELIELQAELDDLEALLVDLREIEASE